MGVGEYGVGGFGNYWYVDVDLVVFFYVVVF